MKRRTSIDSFRENLRLQQVYNVFWRYGMDSLFDKGVLGDFRRYMQEKVYDPPQGVVALSMPVRTRLMLQELGPTYVKMGQIISSRSEVLPKEWQDELAKLQSNVPPFPVEQVRDIIVQELGAPPEELFATFDPEPLATVWVTGYWAAGKGSMPRARSLLRASRRTTSCSERTRVDMGS